MKQLIRKLRFAAIWLTAVLLAALTPAMALAESYSAVVMDKTVSVFNDPALSDRAGSLKRGAVVVVEEVNGTTAMISYNGVSGYYCSIAGLQDVLEVGLPAVVNASGVKVYEKADTDSKSVSIAKGEEVTVLAVDDSWALIEKNGYGCYMYKGYLTLVEETLSSPAPSATASAPDLGSSIECTVTASSLVIYKSASESSSKLGTLEFGDEVIVVAYNSSWAYLYYEGVYGYSRTSGLIKTSLLATAEPTAEATAEPIEVVVSADSVKVYTSASTSSKVMNTLKKGTELNVIQYNSTWAKVEKNGYVGYCKTSALTRKDQVQATATPDTSNAIAAVVTADSVKVYTEPSTSGTLMTTLKKGAEVNVLAYNSTWAYIEKNGYTGYCKVNALSKATAATPTASATTAEKLRTKYPDIQFTATVVYDYAPVYYNDEAETPGTKLSLGTQVDIYAYNSKWAYIGIGDSRGFVATKYLNNGEYTALTSGNSGANVLKLQETLETLGYFDGIPGGNYSSLTTSAVRRFQAAAGLEQTGAADLTTLRVLYGGYAPECSILTSSLGSGSSGDNVSRVQSRLYYLDYLSKASSIDGSYGTTTTTAVKLFQEQAQLSVTGNLDSATMRALYSNDAPSLPSGRTAADYTYSSSSNTEMLKIPSGLASTQTYLPSNASAEEKIEYVIYLAQCQLGKPYIYATAGPDSFDCSGLTVYCFRKVNISLGRSAYAQGYNSSSGTKIGSISELKRGDIVCFDTISDSDISDHVGIYLGNGYFIHASSGTSNGRQVCISNLSSGYYNRVFSWGRRPIE